MDYFNLAGKTALITGASSGIGRAIALAFAAGGVHVLGIGRNMAQLKALCQEMHSFEVLADFLVCDVTDLDQIAQTVVSAIEHLGHIDILVNAAGILPNPLKEEWTTLWPKTLTVNLLAPIHMCNCVSAYMQQQQRGKIINVTSIGDSLVPSAQMEAYGTTKAALRHYSACLAVTLAPHNIQVNVLAPGYIETSMSSQLPTTYTENILLHTPLRSAGTPADIQGAAIFLASSASDYMHGTTLVVDGGFSARIVPTAREYTMAGTGDSRNTNNGI